MLARRKDCQVVAEAAEGHELLRLLEQKTPDLVILDITTPTLGGIEATRRIKAASTGAQGEGEILPPLVPQPP